MAAEQAGLELQMQQANASMSEFQANIAYEVEKGRLRDLMELEVQGTPEYKARMSDLRKHLGTRPMPKAPAPTAAPPKRQAATAAQEAEAPAAA